MTIPRYFTDAQLEELDSSPEHRERGKECPVCLGDGWFKYKGERFECPDDDYGHPAMRLARLYWLSGIPLQYQTLLWDEFPAVELKGEVEDYITYFRRLRLTGVGMTIYGEQLGVGKTWAATHILRELVKQGYSGWFASFLDVKNYYEVNDKHRREFLIRKVRESELLVLDEVKHPWTPKMRDFYEDKLEELLRYRTNINFPTIITSNMLDAEFEEQLPRVFSLLAAKNNRMEIGGVDARVNGLVWENNSALAFRGETRPIT